MATEQELGQCAGQHLPTSGGLVYMGLGATFTHQELAILMGLFTWASVPQPGHTFVTRGTSSSARTWSKRQADRRVEDGVRANGLTAILPSNARSVRFQCDLLRVRGFLVVSQ